MRRILLTGANGFIGRATRAALDAAGLAPKLAVRRAPLGLTSEKVVVTGELETFDAWSTVLRDVDCVVHTANVAHVNIRELARARSVNVNATARLAQAAALAGVARFVYVSSVKVHGERTSGVPFNEHSPLAPDDEYAVLKAEAEAQLLEISGQGGFDLVVVRPPLVYGPGVKANFLRLMRAVERGLPLPFASVNNQRSLIYVGNLADAIVRCVQSPAAVGRIYLLSDGMRVSTPELCKAMGNALGRPARLFSAPLSLLELMPPLRRLTRSLEIDDSAIRRELSWAPPFSFEEGIRATAEWYLENRRSIHS